MIEAWLKLIEHDGVMAQVPGAGLSVYHSHGQKVLKWTDSDVEIGGKCAEVFETMPWFHDKMLVKE